MVKCKKVRNTLTNEPNERTQGSVVRRSGTVDKRRRHMSNKVGNLKLELEYLLCHAVQKREAEERSRRRKVED